MTKSKWMILSLSGLWATRNITFFLELECGKMEEHGLFFFQWSKYLPGDCTMLPTEERPVGAKGEILPAAVFMDSSGPSIKGQTEPLMGGDQGGQLGGGRLPSFQETENGTGCGARDTAFRSRIFNLVL